VTLLLCLRSVYYTYARVKQQQQQQSPAPPPDTHTPASRVVGEGATDHVLSHGHCWIDELVVAVRVAMAASDCVHGMVPWCHVCCNLYLVVAACCPGWSTVVTCLCSAATLLGCYVVPHLLVQPIGSAGTHN
jgi:hypothetical protein